MENIRSRTRIVLCSLHTSLHAASLSLRSSIPPLRSLLLPFLLFASFVLFVFVLLLSLPPLPVACMLAAAAPLLPSLACAAPMSFPPPSILRPSVLAFRIGDGSFAALPAATLARVGSARCFHFITVVAVLFLFVFVVPFPHSPCLSFRSAAAAVLPPSPPLPRAFLAPPLLRVRQPLRLFHM